jgi:hypothetical protein
MFVRLPANWFEARHVSYDGEEQRVSPSFNPVPNIPASGKFFLKCVSFDESGKLPCDRP